MLLKLWSNTSEKARHALLDALKKEGFTCDVIKTRQYQLIHVHMPQPSKDMKRFLNDACVEKVIPIDENLSHAKNKKAIAIASKFSSLFNRNEPLFIAGPCSVEDETQMHTIAEVVNKSGAQALRGGAFKPRTSPYSFQGLKEDGLKILSKAAKAYNLLSVSEVLSENDIELFIKHEIDIIQVGARNMQNFALLKALGKVDKPILLKRGFVNTIEEWLMSAEYIVYHGNPHVILCERGIRTFEPATRHTLDIGGALAAKQRTSLPVIFDPSHAAGDYRLVESLSLAGIAAGLDGLMVEIHPNPIEAYSDGGQSLKLERYLALMEKIKRLY